MFKHNNWWHFCVHDQDKAHWRSSNFAVTHVRNKIVTFKGGQHMWSGVVRDCIDFWSLHPYLIQYYKKLHIKEIIRSLWEQILSFKRSSHFEKRRIWRQSLLDPVLSLWYAYFSAFWIGHWRVKRETIWRKQNRVNFLTNVEIADNWCS